MSRHGKRSNHNAPEHTQWATCHCGKRGYLTRKLAARARRGHPHKTNLGIYRCPTHNDTWHLGHRPPALTRGDISRDQIGDHQP